MSTRVQRTRTREQDNKRQEARVHRKGEQESRIRWTLWDKGSRLQRTKVQGDKGQQYEVTRDKSTWVQRQGDKITSDKGKRVQ